MKFLLPLIIILSVAGITLAMVWFRYDQLAVPAESADKAMPSRGLFTFAFTMAAFLFGVTTATAFYFATGWWTNARSILFFVALGITIFFSVAAAIVRTKVIGSGALESIVLNIVWGMGYGGLLPAVMSFLGLTRG